MTIRVQLALSAALGLVMLAAPSLVAQQRPQAPPPGVANPAARPVSPAPRVAAPGPGGAATPVSAPAMPASGAAGGGINVALIDISEVFKNHARFKQRAEDIKTEVKDYEGKMNEQRTAINAKRQQLAQYKAGSPEFEKLEAEIAKQIANVEVDAGLKKKEILDREAKIYYDTYKEVEAAVAQFCAARNIGLVLRYDSEEPNANDRASVLRGVNRAVIYQDRIDITKDILNMVSPPQTAKRP